MLDKLLIRKLSLEKTHKIPTTADTVIVLQNEREEADTMILKEKRTHNDPGSTDTGKKAVLKIRKICTAGQKILN